MKKLLLIPILFALTSCSEYTLETFTTDYTAKSPFKKTLIVNLHSTSSTSFSYDLIDKLEDEYTARNTELEVSHYFLEEKSELSLNSSDLAKIEEKLERNIQRDVQKSNADLLLIFKPIYIETFAGSTDGYSAMQLQEITYRITGIDTQTNNTIWSAEFSATSSFDPVLAIKKLVKDIYKILEEDNIYPQIIATD